MVDVVYKPLNQAIPTETSKSFLRDLHAVLLYFGQLKMSSSFSATSDDYNTLYTVPEGKEFYLNTVQLTMTRVAGINPQQSRMLIIIPGEVYEAYNTLLWIDSEQVDQISSATLSPAIPLRLLAGYQIRIWNQNSTGRTSGTISGYEIDKEIVSKLFYDFQKP